MVNLAHAIYEAARKTTGLSLTSDQTAEIWGAGPTKSGEVITVHSALTLSAVWNAVDIVSNAMMMPLFTYERLEEQGKKIRRDHSVFDLLHRRPNPEMRGVRFQKIMHTWKLLWGNARAEIEWNGARTVPLNLWPIHPERSWTRRNEAGNKVHDVLNDDGLMTTLADRDVLHIHGTSLDGLNGLSFVAMGADSLGLAKAQESFGARYFGNNTNPGIALRHPRKQSAEAKEVLRKTWIARHSGDGQQGPAVLDEGMEVQIFSVPNDVAQFLQSRVHSILEMCRWLNISPHKLKELSRATFSNIDKLALEFIGDTVMPLAIDAEQEYTGKLFSEEEQLAGMFVAFNLDGLLRADVVARKKSLEIDRRNGTINADRWLALEDQPPLPDGKGEAFWRPTNMAEVNEGPLLPPRQEEQAMQVLQNIMAGHASLLTIAIERVNKNAANAISRAEKAGKPAPDALKFQTQFVEAISPVMDSLAKCLEPLRADIAYQCSVFIADSAKAFLAHGPLNAANEAHLIIAKVKEAVK